MMKTSHFKIRIRTTLAPLILWGCRQIQWAVQMVRTFPHVVVREIQRPSTQYRIALVLVAVLTLFLSWSLALPPTEIIRGKFL
jgi:hypothetical protein